jgi:DNA-binding SARP family transcriptional activator
MARTEVRLLGEPTVVQAGTTLDSPPPAVQKLLAYLVLNRGRPSQRGTVSAAIWPDSSESQARKRLNTAVWRLRRFLGSDDTDLIVSSANDVAVNPDAAVWDDVSEFTQLTATLQRPAGMDATVAGELETAIRLYQGDLLDGCYDDWLLRARERMLDRYLAALNRLVNWHHRIGNTDQAIVFAKQILERDPLREEVHRVLMRLYAALGDRGRALRQYDVAVAALDEHLGVPPMPETTLLAAQLRHPTSLEVDLRSDDVHVALTKLESALRSHEEIGSMLRATIDLLEGRGTSS